MLGVSPTKPDKSGQRAKKLFPTDDDRNRDSNESHRMWWEHDERVPVTLGERAVARGKS